MASVEFIKAPKTKKHRRLVDKLQENYGDLEKLRWVKQQQLWSEINSVATEFHQSIYKDILRSVSLYLQRLQNELVNGQTLDLLSAVGLILGSNMSDHRLMFDQLVDKIQADFNILSVSVNSYNCATMKMAMSTVIRGFLAQLARLDHNIDVDEWLLKPTKPISFRVLADVYQKQFSRGTSENSPKKRKITKPKTRPLLAVIVEDLESFPSKLLEDLVLICSNYKEMIPLVFIFGFSTAVTTIHKLLPHSVTSLLRLELFYAETPNKYLSALVETMLMNDRIAFKLGHRVLEFVCDKFLCDNFDIGYFVRAMRLCVQLHFDLPQAVLYCKAEDLKSSMKQLRSHPGFANSVALLESWKRKKQIEERPNVQDCLTDIFRYHSSLHSVVKCLALANRMISEAQLPLGKSFQEIYLNSLDPNFFDGDEYQKFLDQLRLMSREDLEVLLNEWLHQLANNVSQNLNNGQMMRFGDDLAQFHHSFTHVDEGQKQLQMANVQPQQTPTEEPTRKKKTLEMIQHELRHSMRLKKEANFFELERNKFVDVMDKHFRLLLAHPTSLALHEVFYFDDVESLKKYLQASPRHTVESALADWRKFDPNGVGGELSCPYTAVAYRLCLEHGKIVNMASWFQSFCQLAGDSLEMKRKTSKAERKAELQARFFRCVAELELLGIVRSNPRRTGQLVKLAFGCVQPDDMLTT